MWYGLGILDAGLGDRESFLPHPGYVAVESPFLFAHRVGIATG